MAQTQKIGEKIYTPCKIFPTLNSIREKYNNGVPVLNSDGENFALVVEQSVIRKQKLGSATSYMEAKIHFGSQTCSLKAPLGLD